MPYSNWRDLAAQNRAVIERAGIPMGDLSWMPTQQLWGGAPQSPVAQTPVDWRAMLADSLPAIQGLAGGQSELAGALQSLLPSVGTPMRAPGGARVPQGEERTFAVAGHVRRALVHVPADLEPGTSVPLVCMLHGCTQDAASFAAATRMNEAADQHGFVVVYPEQERVDNQMACWNWFLSGHQARGAGEPAEIAGIVRELCATPEDWTIDSDRVFVAGLSSGGAMAAILGATYPDLFAAVAVHSGLAYGSATDLPTAFSTMANGGDNASVQGRAAYAAMGEHARPVPTIVIQGGADRRVAPVNAEQVLRASMAANRLADEASGDLDVERPSTTLTGRVDGGHSYTLSSWTDREGMLMHELWTIDGLGHAWSGGAPGGSYTDPRGPDATEAIWRFFAQATAN